MVRVTVSIIENFFFQSFDFIVKTLYEFKTDLKPKRSTLRISLSELLVSGHVFYEYLEKGFP